MLTVLADALFTASLQNRSWTKDPRYQWGDRFRGDARRAEEERRRYRFNPYRDLW